ncbi:MAG TPA: glucose-6-phosphate dehydrogenase assembly protein OpcA [Pseudonocardiaceae bacterium]|nr:glucose-6-phosphate dehydrogenase assembly protein OpcA [Pseudonocardiaceae bacterium]
MIIDLPSTTTSQVNNKLVELRQEGGATTLGRVLNLVIVTDDGAKTEDAIDAANDASHEHPCRVIVVARGLKKAAPRLDAQIRFGGDAGASEVVVLRLYGALADEGASCVMPLLLPDTPVVAWWPFEAPAVPVKDPIGALAHRRITDSANDRNPLKALDRLKSTYSAGDTDLAWTRLTRWRAYLAAALDLPPHEKVTAASVTGEADSPSTDLLAAWLSVCLKIPVSRLKATSGEGIVAVTLERRTGNVELVRPDAKVGTLSQPGQPDRRIALQRKTVRDCLVEELRRLEPDVIYEETLRGLSKVVRGKAASTSTTRRASAAKTATSKAATKAPASTAKPAGTRTKSAPASASAKATTAKAATNGAAPAAAKAAPRKARSTAANSANSATAKPESATAEASAGGSTS